MEDQLKKTNSGYLVGSSVTVADFWAITALTFCVKLVGLDTKTAEFPLVKEFVERVESLPKIAEYIKARPDTLL